MNNLIAIYIRVSTGNQELNNQLNDLKEYCKKQNWKIARVFSDVVTGKETREGKRPGFDKGTLQGIHLFHSLSVTAGQIQNSQTSLAVFSICPFGQSHSHSFTRFTEFVIPAFTQAHSIKCIPLR